MLDKLKNEGCYMSYLRNINVRWGCFDFTDVLKMRFKDDEVERYMIEKGDLVLCEGGEPGRCAIWDKANPIMFQKALHRIRCYGGVLNEYLKYVIEDYAKANKLEEYYTGSTIKHLTGESLVSILFPLPPVKEQERIVQEIQRYLSLVAIIENNKENLLAAIKQAKSKVLDLAIHGKLVPQAPNEEPAIELLKRINPKAEIITDNGHYQKLPVGWCEVWLGEIFNHNTGKALNTSNTEGIMRKYLTTSNVYWNTFDFTTVKQMYFKNNELDKCSITKGDLLVCEGGDIGRAAIWNYDYNICIQNHLHRLRPKINGLCVFFYYYVFNYLKVNNMIGGKGIGLLGLSSNALHKLHVPFPPLAEQTRIAAKIEELFHQLDMIEESL